MKIKSFIATTAMLLSLAAIGSARSWGITVDSNTKVGNVTLPAGTYTVKVDNNQALFVSDSGKKFTVPVKVGTPATKKYDQTEMKTQKEGDSNVIQTIDLGGTNEELQFGE
jgi:TfoX/Sxy family transcriptional regulator of competence genes